MEEGLVYTVPVSIQIGKNVTVKISFRKKTQRNKYIRGNMRTKSLGKRSNYPGDMMQYQIPKSTIQLSVQTPGAWSVSVTLHYYYFTQNHYDREDY